MGRTMPAWDPNSFQRGMPAWDEEDPLMELLRRSQARQMPAWEEGSYQPPAPRWSLPELAEVQLDVPSRMPIELEEQQVRSRPPMQLPEETITARPPMQVDGLEFSPGQAPQRYAAQQPPELPANPYEGEEDPLMELVRAAEAQQGAIAREAPQPQQPMPAAPPQPQYSDMASRAETPGGARPNYLGHEDEHVYSPDDRIARAGQAYQALPPDQAAQGPGNRWEDEYLNSRKTYSDDDMWRSWMLTTLGGKEGDNFRMRESQMRDRQLYDQGLAHARAQDQKAAQEAQGNQRVSQAMAELAAQSGTISPEAAAAMRLNDPAVQGIVREGVPLGVRRMEMDTNRERQKERGLTELQLAEMNNDTRRDISNQRSQTQLDVADKYAAAKKAGGAAAGGQGGGRGVGDDVLAAHLDEVGNIGDLSLMKRYLAGDVQPGEIPPAKLALLERERAIFTALPPKKQMEVLAAGSKRESGSVDHVGTFVDKAKADPKYAYKTQTDITNTAGSLKKAVQGWSKMSEEGKQAFVQLAPQGWAAIAKSAAIPEADKQYAGAVHGVMNELVKERAGSAVTESEWGRTAAELGLASGQWDPFNSSTAVQAYLNRAREKILRRRKDYERIVGWQ